MVAPADTSAHVEDAPTTADKPKKVAKEPSDPKPPTSAQIEAAMKTLREAKSDAAAWFHVIKLFKAIEGKERDCVVKYQYWSFSMYWQHRRMGLLQKDVGSGATHVASWGGTFCPHIGIPFVASELYVGALKP